MVSEPEEQFFVDRRPFGSLDSMQRCTRVHKGNSMKITRSVFALAIVLTVPIAVLAQFETASVLGTVKDATGAVVVGSKITLENIKTGVASTTVSNESGNFDF